MKQFCFGIDVGGTTVKLGLFNLDGIVLDKWEIPTRREEAGRYILSDVANAVNQKIKEASIEKEQVLGIGIGVPGPVLDDGTVLYCVNLGWDRINVSTVLENFTGLSTKVANDANIAALGEMWKGGGIGFQSLVLVTLGTGVGGGVIMNGEIVTGSNGAAGEIGHICVNIEEKDSCNCGKTGCLEQFTSATGMVKEAKRLLEKSNEPSALRQCSHISAKTIFDCAKAGDILANQLVDQLGKYLGLALSHVGAVLDPQAYVIGGGVSNAGEILTDRISFHYKKFSMEALKNKEFRLAKLGNDAGIYGGARLIVGV